MKRIYNLFILCFIAFFTYLAVSTNFEMDCIFKKYLGICCPGCGLTRSFRCILNFDIAGAIHYNILGVPLFLGTIIGTVMLVRDIILNDNMTVRLFQKIMQKYYIVIIVLLVVTMVINNINGI